MARPDSLIPGNYYFFICYYDENSEVPEIETWIFREQFRDDNGRNLWLFCEPSNTSRPEEDLEQMALDEDQLLMVLDIHGLQEALIELEDLYPRVEPSANNHIYTSVAVQRTDFSDLEKHIDEFLKSEKANALTVTIRYTDNGLSLVKRNGGIEAVFFIHWKIHPEREQKTRAFFQNRNIAPNQDYCASRPRVRVLSYPLPVQHPIVIDIAVNVFKEIYEITNRDELTFHVREANNK